MYEVYLYETYNRDVPRLLHSPYSANLNKLSNGKVKLVLDGIDQFEFSLNAQHEAYQTFTPIVNHVEVKELKSGKTVFLGRIRSMGNAMQGFEQSLTAESLLSYLYDGYQVFQELSSSSIEAFFKALINQHNKTVESHKQFQVGRVTVTNSTDNVFRGIGYGTTMDVIKDKLINRLGGYLKIDTQTSPVTIHYLASVGKIDNSSPLEMGRNVLTANRLISTDDLATRIIPVGADIEGTHGENDTNSDVNRPKVTIASVNNGKVYLDDKELQAQFGVIPHIETFSDVHTPAILKTKGQNWLATQKKFLTSWSITAANLALLNRDMRDFEVGNFYPIKIPLIAAEENVQVIEKSIDILQPERSDLRLGDKYKTLSRLQNELKTEQKSADQVRQSANTQTIEQVNNLEARLQALEESGTAKGIDVSESNSGVDWAALAAEGYTFAMIAFDNEAESHLQGAQNFQCGLFVNSMATNSTEAAAEADLVCDLADSYRISYPISFSWNYESEQHMQNKGLSPSKTAVSDIALAFLNRVTERGYQALNFSDVTFYNQYFDDRVKLFDWWLERLNVSSPGISCMLWRDTKKDGLNLNQSFKKEV
ncbi:phage tail spike protein [Listeria fleischmannii]|uniref:Phage minor structural protein domain protein n=1 Tax=Listeria fleischmannii FSL S10-1203 TaxID=1265822 RepID=W7DS98_9LIST|nr:phage tail spike protein [Listeria fleischmannii]EUJ64750.1 phage minor structural protein domain protein [Listeria fleischmannii FSL S10-1203]